MSASSSQLSCGSSMGRTDVPHEQFRAGRPAVTHGALAARVSRSIVKRGDRRLRRSFGHHAANAVADDVDRPGHRVGRDRRAAGQRLDDARCRTCRCGWERRRHPPRRRSRQVRCRCGGRGNERRGYLALSAASSGPSPTTTLLPGRSRSRKAGRFFSIATRPTQRKIGPGQIQGPCCLSGRRWSVSTPRVHGRSLVKPRAASSSASDGVATSVPCPELWKWRSQQ